MPLVTPSHTMPVHIFEYYPLRQFNVHGSGAQLSPLVSLLDGYSNLNQSLRLLTDPGALVKARGLPGSSAALMVAWLWTHGNIPVVVIVPDDTALSAWQNDLSKLCPDTRIGIAGRKRKQSILKPTDSIDSELIGTLQVLHEQTRSMAILDAGCLSVLIPAPTVLDNAFDEVNRGREIPFTQFVHRLLEGGYDRQDYVSSPGEVAIRGGIIDLFPPGHINPLRFEFWGDVVDSVREFEVLSQRSIRELDSVRILSRVFHEADQGLISTVADYLPPDSLIILPHADELSAVTLPNGKQLTETLTPFRQLWINALGTANVTYDGTPQPLVAGSVKKLLEAIVPHANVGHKVYLTAEGERNTQRMRNLVDQVADEVESDDNGIHPLHSAASSIRFINSSLSHGFSWPSIGLTVFTEHEVFGRNMLQARPITRSTGLSLRELRTLQKGDYVVHADKGVGRFDGLHTITIGGNLQECVKLKYAGTDVLWVHLSGIQKLSKYSADGESAPSLSRLGSAEWERQKARVKKKIKDIARNLINLYALRKTQTGFAFPSDTVWQQEMEASFQYEDTTDQARTTSEVKTDMEQPVPMDRLVCGDVGFGKTEIAVRAAFKAAQSGRQVAVLVPTTILAHQHMMTFHERLSRYPVNIDVLSRFRSRADQKQILANLSEGRIDIIVGTHRLLSKDIKFHKLGLLIIDEEHRFGVAAKEKLRELRASVDTLTLTATPIPRTLNFSLMGARDLSVIETPPLNRLPIVTNIMQWDDAVLTGAIEREIARGGQVFVVNDKIEAIEKLSSQIRALSPEIRLAVAHGQMPGEELEDVMAGFLERRYDVLVATKIIESGLDIPNANTIIVVNADNFGLAELYQLRGRVGRSNIQAYCYLVIPSPHTLTQKALRRLQALEEFTDLGSGFQLAMRDLEIRGAGNLLGGEQSGFITTMGFELYHQILDEAVSELRSTEFSDLFEAETEEPGKRFANPDVVIETHTDALIPGYYVPSDSERYMLYKRMYEAGSEQAIEQVLQEMRDRYGPLPAPAEELFRIVRIRLFANPIGLSRLRLAANSTLLEFPSSATAGSYYDLILPAMLPELVADSTVQIRQHGDALHVVYASGDTDRLITLLMRLQGAVNEVISTGVQA